LLSAKKQPFMNQTAVCNVASPAITRTWPENHLISKGKQSAKPNLDFALFFFNTRFTNPIVSGIHMMACVVADTPDKNCKNKLILLVGQPCYWKEWKLESIR
jgi:hypothetical protein